LLNVQFISGLKQYTSAGSDGLLQVVFWDGITVADIIETTDLKSNRVKYIIMVNGKRKLPDYCLHDGDDIIVMPLLVGG
jgi:sulfur carrier protein ThiS